MKIVSTGNGNIGSRLVKLGCDLMPVNLLDNDSVRDSIKKAKPDLIIHSAGMSHPDECEKYPDKARSVNAFGTNLICQNAEEIIGDGRVLYISTDHVFDGATGNYKETDDPLPVNEYGRTKLAAEGITQLYGGKIIRLSRGFDNSSQDIKSFGLALKSGGNIYVPDFIYRSYSHFDHLAEGIVSAAKMFDELPTTLHIASQESESYYKFILRVGTVLGWACSAIFPRKEEDKGFTPRPLKCGLDTEMAQNLGIKIYHTAESVGLL